MTVAGWLKQAVEGAQIRIASGRWLRIVEVSDTGIVVLVGGKPQALILPMRELRASVALGGRLGGVPSVPQLCALGIPPDHAVYLRTVHQELVAIPGSVAWMSVLQARQGDYEAHS